MNAYKRTLNWQPFMNRVYDPEVDLKDVMKSCMSSYIFLRGISGFHFLSWKVTIDLHVYLPEEYPFNQSRQQNLYGHAAYSSVSS